MKSKILNSHQSDFKMAQVLEPMIDTNISVITNDGRVFVGLLKGFDQTINIVMENCHERVYHEDEGVESVTLGLYVIRGDNIAVIGEIDEEVEQRIDLASVRAAPLKVLVH